MKILFFSLISLIFSLSHGAVIVSEDFSNPPKESNSGADGFLGSGGEGFNYNDSMGVWLYSSGNGGIDDAAVGSGSGDSVANLISSIGLARAQAGRGTNARAISVVFEDSLFVGGGEYTVSFDVIGDMSGFDSGAYWLAEIAGYDSGGSNFIQIDGTQGGWGSGAGFPKPFVANGTATVKFLKDSASNGVALSAEDSAGTTTVSFTFTYDATDRPDIAFAVGTYNNIFAIDDFSIAGPPPPPPPPPPGFEPNPNGGVEPAPLTGLNPVPNVVIFIADDMGIGDTSAYQDLTGNADAVQIDTPQMERLANLGVRFTDAHTNGATCSPSRISLLSGTYSFRSPLKIAAVRDTDHIHGVILPGRRTTIGHMLQRNGYRTYGYGKWHMALRGDSGEDTDGDGTLDVIGSGVLAEGPIESGFHTYTGTPGNFSYAGAMIQDKQYMRFGSASLDDYSLVPINDPSAQPWIGQGPARPTDENLYKVQPAIFEKLKTDITTHMDARADEPFFIYYASHSNHDPYVPANYDPDHPSGPRASLNGVVIDTNVTKAGGMIDIVTKPDMNGDGIPDPDYAYYEAEGSWIWNDAFRKKWWDHVTEVDEGGNITVNGPTNRAMMVQENDVIVGYMLDFLEQTDDPRNPGHKLIDNTIFIFTSDNGADARSEAAVGALPQSSDGVITNISGFKGNRWEGGNRVPFIAAWPDPGDPSQSNGIPSGLTSPAVFGLNDIYATIADAIGHRLEPDEAVDSESLLGDWTDPIQNTAVVRSSDLLYKYQERIFSRRGEYKLAAIDSDYVDGSQDRFANSNNLDFLNMVLDYNENNWNQFVRGLVNLSTDLDESQEGDLLQANPVEPSNQALADDMLADVNNSTNQGFSRIGATAFKNGYNFEGGDLLTASNWHAYKNSRDNTLPTGIAPGIIAEDGTATGTLSNITLIHRAGTLAYSPGNVGVFGSSLYELDGGTLTTDDDFRLSNARFGIYRGVAQFGANALALKGNDCVVIISGGEITAANLSVGESGSNGGFKIVRFKGGAGTLELTGDDPIKFGDDGSSGDDFIDFVSGARGRLLTQKDSSYFSALWDLGQLRIDGFIGSLGQFGSSGFKLIALGDGRNALILDVGQPIDFDHDGINDVWEQDKVGSMDILNLTGDYDGDGILDPDEYLLDYDPNVPESPFSVKIHWNSGTGKFEISFDSKNTRRYVVQFAEALSSATSWESVNLAAGNNGPFTFSHSGGASRGFYKVQVFLP